MLKNKKLIRTILIIAAAAFVIIQFFQIDKTNPSVDVAQDFIQNTNPPAEIATILKTACYDCHSHTTKYPWYTNIQPFAWWIKGHVDNGNKHLNYSTWSTYSAKKKAHKIEEMVDMVEGKEMPMLSYMIGHNDAWIDAGQRQALV
ncbi:MAG: heme-binding domain-containing protein, partial [Saprospiraceae bacterium]